MNRDPGLEPERTALAWRRTALSMLVNAALLVRAAAEKHSLAFWTIAVLGALSALLLFTVGWHRHQTLGQLASPPSSNAAMVAFAVASAWLACGAAAWTMLT